MEKPNDNKLGKEFSKFLKNAVKTYDKMDDEMLFEGGLSPERTKIFLNLAKFFSVLAGKTGSKDRKEN